MEIKLQSLDSDSKYFYEDEIKKALLWLINTRHGKEKGWAWIEHIAPNEQNTAEVIVTLIDNLYFSPAGTIEVIAESAKIWLLNPKKNARITFDFAWVLIALVKCAEHEKLSTAIGKESLDKAIKECVDWISSLVIQNSGLSDITGAKPTISRTSIGLLSLSIAYKYIQKDLSLYNILSMNSLLEKISILTNWIIKCQNNDGGWGNIQENDIDFKYQNEVSLSYSDLRYQCDSNPACTGYVLVALAHTPLPKRGRTLEKARNYLISHQKNNGC